MPNLFDPGLLERLDSDPNPAPSWGERYRPRNLEQMALHPEVRRHLESYVRAGPPHRMILHGPPATGKTTAAEIMASCFPSWAVVRVNGSETGDVEYMHKVLRAIRAEGGMLRKLGEPFQQLLIISEADSLSRNAEAMLKDPLEELQATTSFIATTNAPERMSEAVRSRCANVEMLPPPVDERWRILTGILAVEGVQYDPTVAIGFAKAFADMRELIRTAQDSFAMYGELRLPPSVAASVEASSPMPVDGCQLLNALASKYERYLSLPQGAATALSLWTVFAHAHEAFTSSPILAATSPVKGSGKTRTQEVMRDLVPDPFTVSALLSATLHRLGGEVNREAASYPPEVPTRPVATLLADEAENYMRGRGSLRSALDSGHTRRFAFIPIYERGELLTFSTWYPKFIALIDTKRGEFPPTVRHRSIVIEMMRRRPDENVERFRSDRIDEESASLKKQCVRWRNDHFAALKAADPEVPHSIGDRAADSWRPLLAIADEVGGEWPAKAREACMILTGSVDESAEMGLRLIEDVVRIFATDSDGRNYLPTQVLLEELAALEDQPWEGMTPIHLATHLRAFGIRSRDLWAKVRDRKRTVKGYFQKDFLDAHARYCEGNK